LREQEKINVGNGYGMAKQPKAGGALATSLDNWWA